MLNWYIDGIANCVLQRRCIHDENGNEDPVKAAEALVPRHASASKKRKAGPGPGNNSAVKKTKASRTTVAANEPDVPQPQNQGIMARAAKRLNALVAEPLTESPEGLQSNMDLAQQALLQVISPTNDPPENPEIPPQQPSTETTDAQQDPSPSNPENPAPAPTTGEDPSIQPSIPPIDDTDEFHHLATSPLSELDELNDLSDLKWEPDFDPPLLSASPSFQPPPAASLVSPPASHTDAERTPPAPSNMQTITPSATSSSSRHSSRANKTVQRYTPESGSVRRNSTSSAGKTRESGSPVGGSAGKGEGGGSAMKKGKSRRESELGDKNEESMRLIRELQAQDMGLRRRARG